jgi:KaiC/GvpD/RAD55 family RecA-like ATPase
MDDATLNKRWEQIGRGELTPTPESHIPTSTYYKPLSDAVNEFVHWAQTPDERIYLGFDSLDNQMRGVAPSEMLLVNGYSHSGKTLFLLSVLNANRDKTVVYFCPDEPRTLTLVKLACVANGVNAYELEQQVADNDPRGIDLLKHTAIEQFPNLAVFDQPMTLSDMEKAMGETTNMLGKPAVMVFDYLELLQGGGEDVPSKANTIKAFGKRHHVPLVVLHQSSRTAGADGRKMTISSGAYGGEQQASHIIGVRRKKFEIEAQIQEINEKLAKGTATERLLERLDTLRYEERIHENTVTLNLVKCKRPASSLLDDIDFEIEQGTGRLLPMGPVPHDMSVQARHEAERDQRLESESLSEIVWD